jgi:type IV secretory pathway VirB10-like protein
MSGHAPDNGTPEAPPAELRLQAERPRVTRLSRKVLIGLGGIASAGIFGLGFWALQPRSGNQQPQQLYNTQSRNIADGIANLPSDYTGLSKPSPPLGPPLPGDLGPPILHAQQQGNVQSGETADQQRLAQEQQAALTSGLFVQAAAQSVQLASNEAPQTGATPTGGSNAPPSDDPTAIEGMQDEKLAFMNGPVDRDTISPDRIMRPVSPYIVQAGWVIPGALITGIKSDIPGDVTAQVTENVYDSATGHYLLIPQGSKLFGKYDSQIAFAQTRVQMVWTRVIFPDGASIILQRLPGADPQGYSGLEDQVNDHWVALFKAAVLSTILSVGAEAGTSNSENNLAQAIREGASQSISETGQQIVERNLNIQPTLTDRPGLPVRIIVDQDLVLEPYRG